MQAAGIAATTNVSSGTTAATLTSSQRFSVDPSLTPSINATSVSAVDGGSNTATNNYQISLPSSTSISSSTSTGATETITLANYFYGGPSNANLTACETLHSLFVTLQRMKEKQFDNGTIRGITTLLKSVGRFPP